MFKSLTKLIVILVFTSCSTSKYDMPRNKIDQPLTLQEGMNEVLASYGEIKTGGGTDGVIPIIAYNKGLTNRHTTSYVLPYVHHIYSLNDFDDSYDGKIKTNKFYSAISGGLVGLGYSEQDGLRLKFGLGYHTKYLFNNYLYDEISANLNYWTGESSVSDEKFSANISYGLGLKITNGIDLNLNIYTNYAPNRTVDYGYYDQNKKSNELSGYQLNLGLSPSEIFHVGTYYGKSYINFFSDGTDYHLRSYGGYIRFTF